MWPPPLGPEAFQTQAAYPAPGGWLQEGALGSQSGPPPLFGWYPDPAGIHEQRYWDGRQWSHRVSDGSVRSDDPLPAYKAGRASSPGTTEPRVFGGATDDSPPPGLGT
ncbi:MAG TPA: DUF2510 domain-containing protein [Acidimicrobiales bacterium]|nr:DUF2510 domain-containing protein [Acidimicrobiales bacterium]